MSDLLLSDCRDRVATLTLNRPAQRNALSAALLADLQSALDALAADRSVRVVVLAGSGPAFSSGHDLKEIQAMPSQEDVERLFLACSRVMTAIVELPKPVIAKVHGIATAAGCQLVAACDLAVASSNATFATPGVNTGAFCATPGVALSRAVSRKHALEMLLTGAPISAQRAAEIGLVNRVVPPERLDEEVASLATLLASKSGSALAAGKRLFSRQLEMPLKDAYALASGVIAESFVGPDGKEGVAAFLEKRPPRWM
jgi:enoyl-CoA hydratase/carnithine racemase